MGIKLNYLGSTELLKQIEAAGGSVEDAVIAAIRKSAEKPSEEMQSFIRKHKRTGQTERSWTEEIKNRDGIITGEFGFSIKKGGLPALFWNVGTPRKAPAATYFIDNALENNIDEIIEAQNTAIREVFSALIK